MILNLYGNYDQALSFYQKALSEFLEIGDKSGEGTTLNNMATTAHARGDYDTALTYLERSLKIRQEIGDKSGMIATLHNMAMIAFQNNDYQKDYEYTLHAYQLAAETRDALGLFHVGQHYGQILHAMGKKEEGLRTIKTSYTVGKQAGFPDIDHIAELIKQLEKSRYIN